MKLKVGDRVKVISKESNFFKCEGVIVGFMGNKYPNVKLDPGQDATMPISDTPWLFIPNDIELV